MLNNIESFSQKTINALNHYVYALVNPADETIFYVGMGKGNRGFNSIKKIPKGNNELKSKIKGLRAEGIEPRLDILRYGMDKETAQEVEAAIIDSFGVSNLSNEIRGIHTKQGRTRAYDLNIQLGGKLLNIEDIQDNVILFFCHKALAKHHNYYDSTRQFWKLSEKRIKKTTDTDELFYKYAFTMRGNTVLEVYRILEWFSAGTTVSTRVPGDMKNRWEFIGGNVSPDIEKLYKNKMLFEKDSPLRGTQGGVRYLEIKTINKMTETELKEKSNER